MASEEDNFDIDIYGDGEDEGNEGDYKQEDSHITLDGSAEDHQNHPDDVKTEDLIQSAPSQQSTPVPQQGIKRKESSDDRPVDPGATPAVMISDLHWWTTEDDVRGWASQADCEGELKDVTFSEHKVNGKSKGQAFVEFTSAQASSAMRHQIDTLGGSQPGSRKYAVLYCNPHQNPFKTYPKDGPARGKDERPQRTPSNGPYNPSGPPVNNYNSNNSNGSNINGGYRGGRGGGYRGNSNNNSNNNVGGGFNNNRNFSNPMNQYSPGISAGFQNNMGGMNNFGGFNNRGGGMMNNRGGMGGMGSLRGGRGGNMGGGMAMMGGMGGMGAMRGMNMGMSMGGLNPMMTGMGMQGPVGFQGGNPQFNPAFFNPGQAGAGNGADSSWNPHGAKRTRQE